MAIFPVPNPKSEVTIDESIQSLHTHVADIATRFQEYTLLENDKIMHRIRILVKENDSMSKLTLDQGQHLTLLLSPSQEMTKVVVEVSRAVGSFDQQYEVNRASNTINRFLTVLSKSIEGKLEELIEHDIATDQENNEKSKAFNKILLLVLFILIALGGFMIMRIRKANHAAVLPTNAVTNRCSA